MENEVKVESLNVEQTTETSTVTEPIQEQPKVKSSEVLRELSKKYGVNLFEPDGIKAFEDMIESKAVQEEQLKAKYTQLEETHRLTQQKAEEKEVQVEALRMGFNWSDETQYKELIALAKVNTPEGKPLTDGLNAIKDRYASMFAKNQIGIQFSDLKGDTPDPKKAEAEKYLSKSKAYTAWQEQQAKRKH